jgi:hypothetical protein
MCKKTVIKIQNLLKKNHMLKKKKMMRIFNKIYTNYKKMLFKMINKNMKSKKIIKLYPNNNKKVLHIYLQKIKI